MNLSGGPVSALLGFYKVSPERVVVIHDELDVAFGALRLKLGGGDNGHNGLRSITPVARHPRLLSRPLRHRPPPGTHGPGRFRPQGLLSPGAQGTSLRPRPLRRRGGGPDHQGPGRSPKRIPHRPGVIMVRAALAPGACPVGRGLVPKPVADVRGILKQYSYGQQPLAKVIIHWSVFSWGGDRAVRAAVAVSPPLSRRRWRRSNSKSIATCGVASLTRSGDRVGVYSSCSRTSLRSARKSGSLIVVKPRGLVAVVCPGRYVVAALGTPPSGRLAVGGGM